MRDVKHCWVIYRDNPPSEFGNANLVVFEGEEARDQIVQLFLALKTRFQDGHHTVYYTEDNDTIYLEALHPAGSYSYTAVQLPLFSGQVDLNEFINCI